MSHESVHYSRAKSVGYALFQRLDKHVVSGEAITLQVTVIVNWEPNSAHTYAPGELYTPR